MARNLAEHLYWMRTEFFELCVVPPLAWERPEIAVVCSKLPT